MSAFFRETPNVAVCTQQQQEPEALVSSAAVRVSRGGDEVESDTCDAFHHKDVSIKAVEPVNYSKYWLMFLPIRILNTRTAKTVTDQMYMIICAITLLNEKLQYCCWLTRLFLNVFVFEFRIVIFYIYKLHKTQRKYDTTCLFRP